MAFQIEDGSILSAIGGAFSLYLGISIAMVFEILELLFDLAYNCFKRRKTGSASARTRLISPMEPGKNGQGLFEVVASRNGAFP